MTDAEKAAAIQTILFPGDRVWIRRAGEALAVKVEAVLPDRLLTDCGELLYADHFSTWWLTPQGAADRYKDLI